MLYFLAHVLPPLAVIRCDKREQLVLNIILTILFWMPGVIHAMFIVDRFKGQHCLQDARQANYHRSDLSGVLTSKISYLRPASDLRDLAKLMLSKFDPSRERILYKNLLFPLPITREERYLYLEALSSMNSGPKKYFLLPHLSGQSIDGVWTPPPATSFGWVSLASLGPIFLFIYPLVTRGRIARRIVHWAENGHCLKIDMTISEGIMASIGGFYLIILAIFTLGLALPIYWFTMNPIASARADAIIGHYVKTAFSNKCVPECNHTTKNAQMTTLKL